MNGRGCLQHEWEGLPAAWMVGAACSMGLDEGRPSMMQMGKGGKFWAT
jgi:hypothetical protein